MAFFQVGFVNALGGSDHQPIEQLAGKRRTDETLGREAVAGIIQSERFVIHRVQLLV